MALNKS